MITERDILTRMIGLFLLAGLPLAAALTVYLRQNTDSAENGIRVFEVEAAAGGFQPSSIRVAKGETVKLRFKALDRTHSIAIGPGLNIDLGEIPAGDSKEITLAFEETGTYTYYLNRLVGPDDWRVRGIIDVYDPDNPDALPTPFRDEVIENLVAEGINIDDATHMSDVHESEAVITFERLPSAERGQSLAGNLQIPAEIQNPEWRRTHTPLQALEMLEQANPDISRTDLADVAAYLWAETSVPNEIVILYNKNCSACHGLEGRSEGIAAEMTIERPVAFANLSHMFTRRSDVLYAKIRRGGMGTDMPNFGTIFTPEETWMLVDYIWQLAMRQE